MLLRDAPDLLHVLQGLVILLHLDEAVRHERKNPGASALVLAEQALRHLVRLHQELQRVLVVPKLEVALAEEREDVDVVLLRVLVLVEEFAVLLEGNREVVDGLLRALVVEVGLAEVEVGLDEVALVHAVREYENLTPMNTP